MNILKESVLIHLRKSSLSDEDVLFWDRIIDKVPEEFLEDI